jgi:transcriptional regulator with XRE-family HTH domain
MLALIIRAISTPGNRALPRATGEVLRSARRARGLTLRDVTSSSHGRFKPSVLGAYERGERSISLVRFCELAQTYGIPPDRLLGDVFARLDPAGRQEIAIDLNRLTLIPGQEGKVVAEFVHRLKSQRGDYMTDVITLRSGDLEAISLEASQSPNTLLRTLEPALRTSSPSGSEER